MPSSTKVKNLLKRVPFVVPILIRAKAQLDRIAFHDSSSYWERRYQERGDSGAGSYGFLAHYKAEIINEFVTSHSVKSVVEFGCGDGNQLSYLQVPAYLGLDVSATALDKCRAKFSDDPSKQFGLMSDYRGETADLALSLDVIFHLVEDDVYTRYMDALFQSAERFIIIYSSNTDVQDKAQPAHVLHRKFTEWISEKQPGWRLTEHVKNKYPYSTDSPSGSFSDFYFFENSNAET